MHDERRRVTDPSIASGSVDQALTNLLVQLLQPMRVFLQAISLAEFLQPMLAWDPQQRPTAAQLLQHPYFKPLLEESPQQQQQ